MTVEGGTVTTQPVLIACAADRWYAMPLAVMLRSVIDNLDSRRTLTVYIVDGGIDQETRYRIAASLPERVSIHWILPDRTGFVDLPLWGRMTIATSGFVCFNSFSRAASVSGSISSLFRRIASVRSIEMV